MAASFFFYDLETSGLNASKARIMQFAGIRTDANLKQIGEPVNVLIKLAPDVLPDPDAVMLTGISPQSTLIDGYTEAEFLRFFYDEVVTPDTTFLGYNTVRFDDEFMRAIHYRNFYDPYEWQWMNGCSRWDILDLVRMTRALRPEGIEWPFTDEGKPTNRLELLTKLNGLEHEQAHDALSDVYATIAIAQLIRDKQPDLFNFLFEHRNKKVVSEMVLKGQPFVYTSGRYSSEWLHTSAAVLLAKHTVQDAALIYDLRFDPTPFLSYSPEQIIDAWQYKKDRDPNDLRLPVKTLKYNRCPAVAPLGVIAQPETQERLQLRVDTIKKHLAILQQHGKQFAENVGQAVAQLDASRSQSQPKAAPTTANVDDLMYDGFIGNEDKQIMRAVRAADAVDVVDLASKAHDARLRVLAPLYKARNYPATLTDDERQVWDKHIADRLFTGGQQSQLALFFARLSELAQTELTNQQQFLLEELQLYGQSVMPTDMTNQDES